MTQPTAHATAQATTQATTADVAALLENTTLLQRQASNPEASVWVSANAGTGKTHVLKMRVLRLLLSGAAPEKLLCLTYTNAAAAEMSTRVFDELATWVTLDDVALDTAIETVTGTRVGTDTRNRARTLFTTAIEAPGGLKVQTFHAFCERLLQRFPLEAGVPPGFEILDDATSARLTAEATEFVLAKAIDGSDDTLRNALDVIVPYATDGFFDELLGKALGDRNFRDAIHAGLDVDRDAEPQLRSDLDLAATDDEASVDMEVGAVLDDVAICELRTLLDASSKNDQKLSHALTKIQSIQSPKERADSLTGFFRTKEGKPFAQKSFITKAFRSAHAALADTADRARTRFEQLAPKRDALKVLARTLALLRIAAAVYARYAYLKNQHAGLDYDDLIAKTRDLLTLPGGAEWVLYKLDNGIDHILVDESQDTSPKQWAVVDALAQEFFSGLDASLTARTVFAVGDEKQSIYSFQGAAPHLFSAKGQDFAQRAETDEKPFEKLQLSLSFRTVPPVLTAVDRVFANPAVTSGVRAVDGIRHLAKRAGEAGLVEIWPVEPVEDVAAVDAWTPLADSQGSRPAERVATRIAETIKHWLDTHTPLTSQNRAIRAGDILILLRKRNPLAGPMVAALKKLGIAVAGADRMVLTEQIAVQDLMALGDFLVLPEDDLALATVLKSPMFGLDDDDLFALAYERKGTLWKALLDAAKGNAKTGAAPIDRFRPAADMLIAWRGQADFRPPYEFFATLLDRYGMRKRMLSRLGAEAADPLDEFLNLALTYDEDAPPSLSGFMAWLRASSRQIKRDMDQGRNEVRVMTVHGAKGLEAPIVFLPDTCTTKTGGNQVTLLDLHREARAGAMRAPFLWRTTESKTLAAVKSADDARRAGENEERDRLLYVAMTRARDRLYVAGFDSKNARPDDCWYTRIHTALASEMTVAKDFAGRDVLRLEAPQTAPLAAAKPATTAAEPIAPLPPWALRRAASEPQLQIPVAPSRLAPYDLDETGDPRARQPNAPQVDDTGRAVPPQDPPPLAPLALSDGNRFLRGTLTHNLLEHLPNHTPEARAEAAHRFVQARAGHMSEAFRRSIVDETLAVIADPDFADLFGPNSRAEVTLAAELPHPEGKGPPLKISGQIDRLVVLADRVCIIDYKTNRPPPHDPADVAEAYLLQLAAYKLALAQLYPEREIETALLWTDGPRLMRFPPELIDHHAARVWALGAKQAVP